MNIIEKAYFDLYGKSLSKNSKLNYSGKFKSYNANVRYNAFSLTFNLSKEWRQVDAEIKIGLIQHLLMKVYKTRKNTPNLELYSLFIKNLGDVAPKTQSNPELEQSFERVNEKYFFNILEKPNLRWGSKSFATLGSYAYQTDTITISSVFKSSPRLLDYVMYHEMLHKKHSFKSNKGRSYYHTSKFRSDERKFEDSGQIEKEIRKFISKSKLKGIFSFF